MKISLITLESIRQGIKMMLKQLDYLSLQLVGTAKYGYYVDHYYEYSRKSLDNAIKRAGEELYNETSQESKENITIGNAFLFVYDHLVGISNEDIYHAAIVQGNIEAFGILISRNVYKPQNIITGLIYQGHTELLKEYLKLYSEFATESFYDNLLCFAANNNHEDMLKIAIKQRTNIDNFCYNKSILVLPVRNNYLPNVKLLVEAGAHIPDKILEYCYEDKCTTSGVLPYLVSQGADVNHKFDSTAPLIMYTVLQDHVTTRFLLANGAEINFLFNNKTPLSKVINIGYSAEIIKELILYGANVDVIVNGASILEDMLCANYISHEDKTKIIPLILCNGHYSQDEVSKYIKYAKTDDIKSVLESYTNGENMICSTTMSSGLSNTTSNSLLNPSFAGETSFENITNSEYVY